MIKRYKKDEINELIEILKNDGVISVPTDTVYGLCASINSNIAYNKLIRIKNRPINKAFPIMCADLNQIYSIAIVNKIAEKLIKKFMPGPITLILKRKENLPNYITNGKNTIAVRLATSKELQTIITKLENPIFMTSANKSGKNECLTLAEIENECPMIDGILEGNVTFSQASTIIDCTSEKVKIQREGPVSEEQVNNIIKH